jgi:hypothetical protein
MMIGIHELEYNQCPLQGTHIRAHIKFVHLKNIDLTYVSIT